MASLKIDQSFQTIICCDAFFHNLNMADQLDCLSHISAHITPTGRFLFNLPNPSCEFILNCERSTGEVYDLRGEYPLEDGSCVLRVEQAHHGNAINQTVTTVLRFTLLDADGRQVNSGQSSWTTRYLFRYEAEHLLHRCGFQVNSLVGDYQNRPVTSGSQLIFDVSPIMR